MRSCVAEGNDARFLTDLMLHGGMVCQIDFD